MLIDVIGNYICLASNFPGLVLMIVCGVIISIGKTVFYECSDPTELNPILVYPSFAKLGVD
jgi:hypothetical protein